MEPLVDVEGVLARLKDFQRKTAGDAFARLFEKGGSGRFLVADEAGLGKTMVAKAIIAMTIDQLRKQGVRRIDIIYICTNSAIARQNINRLNVMPNASFTLATRLTMLPTQVEDLDRNPVNLVSFTPATTFDLKSKGGMSTERVILHRMLKDEPDLNSSGLLNLLQGFVGRSSWKRRIREFHDKINETLHRDFLSALRLDASFFKELQEACERFQQYRDKLDGPENDIRKRVVGELRRRLAKVSLNALEPDLVIMDEFQRFKDLLDPDAEDEAASLARHLFGLDGVKILLLSATPYRMLTLDAEEGEDHYPDFLKTLSFLYNDKTQLDGVEKAIREYRRLLYSVTDSGVAAAAEARDDLGSRLRRVMSRCERVGMTSRMDAMLRDIAVPTTIEPGDLLHAAAVDRAAQAVGSRDTIEYWKSSPYLFNFIREYDLRRRIDDVLDMPPDELLSALKVAPGHRLTKKQIEGYQRVDPANARMRYLCAETLDRGMWRLLWMPPSLPYTQPSGAYAEVGEVSKSLLFSAWNIVPDAVAAVVSYEAERRMVEGCGAELTHGTLFSRVKPLLRFTKETDGRLAGMPALSLMHPSPTLAALVDPLRRAIEIGRGAPVTHAALLDSVEREIAALIRDLPEKPSSVPDKRWYWAAPALMDGKSSGFMEWCSDPQAWGDGFSDEEEDAAKGYQEHVRHFQEVANGRVTLGSKPADLARVIAELALGSPGTIALRSLRRVAVGLPFDDWNLLTAARHVADGFRSLFNNPETIAMLRGDGRDESYWRIVAQHCLEGNLQAVLDEQVHVLVESLGLSEAAEDDRVIEICNEINDSLGIRAAQLQVDELNVLEGGKLGVTHFNTRCRFALRFGEMKEQDGEPMLRADSVRKAFNSPFRPFVLASTSVGQEGLDFHTWCHSVIHWNLPANPVDLEQREGRVQRYKGYAVRKNVAKRFGLVALTEGWDGGDPWQHLFGKALASRPACSSDLVPYWIFEVEGGASVERKVPLLPYSREVEQLRRLRKSLALYRLVFGQPRQEDLLTCLTEQMTEEQALKAVLQWRISLAP